MKNLAIIPARGGSKRIPKKNIRDFLGKPIIAYSIEAALQSGLFDEVMVSTDDEEIAAVAKKFGAEVPFLRSPKNSDDYATLADVVVEVQTAYANLNINFDRICCILPTAPLLKIEHLKRGLQLLCEKKFHTVRPIVPFAYPIQRAFLRDAEGHLRWFDEKNASARSQDLVTTFHDAGQFYWIDAKFDLKSSQKGGFVIAETESQDIDNEMDWAMAIIKYKLAHNFL